jgi:hypothetical protein
MATSSSYSAGRFSAVSRRCCARAPGRTPGAVQRAERDRNEVGSDQRDPGGRDRQDVNDPLDQMVEDLLDREVGQHRASELAQHVGQVLPRFSHHAVSRSAIVRVGRPFLPMRARFLTLSAPATSRLGRVIQSKDAAWPKSYAVIGRQHLRRPGGRLTACSRGVTARSYRMRPCRMASATADARSETPSF